jgi:alpha-glucosidase
MKAITAARFLRREGPRLSFLADHGARLAVTVLDDALVRVTLLRAEGWRLDRTWSIAPNGNEPPYKGRSRDELSDFACPDFAVTEEAGRVRFRTRVLEGAVRLDPLGIDWFLPGAAEPFAGDRPTQAYFLSRRTRPSRTTWPGIWPSGITASATRPGLSTAPAAASASTRWTPPASTPS